MPIGRKPSLHKIVVKVFQLALENTFCFIHYMFWIPGNTLREYCFLKKKYRRILPAPLGIRFRLRWDIFLQPGSQRTIAPIVSRYLLTNEASSPLKGIT